MKNKRCYNGSIVIERSYPIEHGLSYILAGQQLGTLPLEHKFGIEDLPIPTFHVGEFINESKHSPFSNRVTVLAANAVSRGRASSG